MTCHVKREEERKQEVEPRESGVKECWFVLEMRAGAMRGRIRAEGSHTPLSGDLSIRRVTWQPASRHRPSRIRAGMGRTGGERRR